jgi:GNAT superfamily N-acetyltransferase
MTQQPATRFNGISMQGSNAIAPPAIAGRWHGPEDEVVSLRHIRAEDYPMVHAFVRGLSSDTAYKRFMAGRRLNDDEIRQWTATDPSREFTLVALAGEAENQSIVGVATCVFESPEKTDFAAVVADAWQHRGIGRDLILGIIAGARQRGLRRLGGITLSTNRAMLTLAQKLGFKTARLVGEYCNTLSLEL